MAFNIFGALGALSRLAPGYIQGRQQAINDNWNDLNQYNTVQKGQMDNAMQAETFDDLLQLMADQVAMSGMNTEQAYNALQVNRAATPGQVATASVNSQTQPEILAGQRYNELAQQMAMGRAWSAPTVQNLFASGTPITRQFERPVDPWAEMRAQVGGVPAPAGTLEQQLAQARQTVANLEAQLAQQQAGGGF